MSDDDSDVQRYLETVTPEKRRRDAETLVDLMSKVTGLAPTMRGTSVGFGDYHYHYPSGRHGDAAATGFAARKATTVVYLPDGIGAHEQRLQRLGPHTNEGRMPLPQRSRGSRISAQPLLCVRSRSMRACS